MTFYIGQKVVLFTHEVPPNIVGMLRDKGGWKADMTIGSVWTIRDIDTRYVKHYGFAALRFQEKSLPASPTMYGDIERGYPAPCFRPVVEKKTDISIFTAMLNTKQRENVLCGND